MRENWTPRPADRVVRHPRQEAIGPVRVTAAPRRPRTRFLSTPLTITYIFLGMIAVGTVLLLQPWASHVPGPAPFLTALFTATSAVTDTGLVVENSAEYWTFGGKIIILGLMYVGGLGFMTLVTVGLVLIGQRVTIQQRLLARAFLSVNQLGGLTRLAAGIVVVATAIQVIGLLALTARFSFIYPLPEAVLQAAFHSVSAFNNAGFSILNEPGQLVDFQRDAATLGILMTLVFIGGISFLVIIDVVRYRRPSVYTLNTKLVLALTAFIIPASVAGFMLPEYANPDTLGPLSVQEKLIGSVFHTLNNRTAGMNIIDYGLARDGTLFLTIGMMFIGGASASTAGGIKVNTLAVILVAAWATLRGKSYPTAFGREIPWEQALRALVIGLVAATFVFAVALTLSVTERGHAFLDVLFETVSAFGTVGYSTGITPSLSSLGQIIISFVMLIGDLGPITLGLMMAQGGEQARLRYPQEGALVG